MLSFRNMEPVRYTPAGTSTVPPPALSAASIADCMAAVSFVRPSPLAPNALTSNTAARAPDGANAAHAHKARTNSSFFMP